MEAFPAAPPPALKEAIALTVMPSRARALREGPLPDGITMLLRIAAGDLDAQREAMDASDRSAQVVKDASGFFIEQMLLFPEADSYRVLGARPDAAAAELRQNMALLMRWLHPDKNPSDARAVFVSRINRAWDDLKTPERRHAYDQVLASRRTARDPNGGSRSPGSRPGTRSGSSAKKPRHPGKGLPRRRELTSGEMLAPLRAARGGFWRWAMRLLGRGPR